MESGFESTPLYERLADEIARQIESGAFRAGDRIPSVRRSSQQRRVSVTTVLQAYQILEERGLIHARPQSGYYVRFRPQAVQFNPPVTAPVSNPCPVRLDELILHLFQDVQDAHMVQFGPSMPDPALLPTKRLNRLLASLARLDDPRYNGIGTPDGSEELRLQVAQRAFLAGARLTPGKVVITNGCTEALHLALRATTKPGDLVAIESPTYYGVLQTMKKLGLQALEIPTHHQDGISLDALEFALDHHQVAACLVVTNFNNPLGSCMPDENKRRLVEMLRSRQIPLIEDDIHGELHFGSRRPPVAKSFDEDGLVLLCSSFCKQVSPSYRIGWLAPGRYYQEVISLKLATSFSTALLPQLAMAQFLESGGFDIYLRRMRRTYAQKVNDLSESVRRHFPTGTQVTCPQGGYVLWVQLPPGSDTLKLYHRAIKAHISFAPGQIFSPTERYSDCLRLNAGLWDATKEGAIRRLGELAGKGN